MSPRSTCVIARSSVFFHLSIRQCTRMSLYVHHRRTKLEHNSLPAARMKDAATSLQD